MKHILSALTLSFVLVGCGGYPEIDVDKEQVKAACIKAGYEEGTEKYKYCVGEVEHEEGTEVKANLNMSQTEILRSQRKMLLKLYAVQCSEDYGFEDGTEAHSNCVLKLDQEARKQAEAADNKPIGSGGFLWPQQQTIVIQQPPVYIPPPVSSSNNYGTGWN